MHGFNVTSYIIILIKWGSQHRSITSIRRLTFCIGVCTYLCHGRHPKLFRRRSWRENVGCRDTFQRRRRWAWTRLTWEITENVFKWRVWKGEEGIGKKKVWRKFWEVGSGWMGVKEEGSWRKVPGRGLAQPFQSQCQLSCYTRVKI